MKLHVISDLHLQGTGDPLYAPFIRILSETAAAGDVIVLAGDIFDLFIGAKASFSREYAEAMAAIRAAGKRGVRLHYIEGNHDFLMRQAFAGMENVHVHSSEVSFEIEGTKFYIAHGDLVDRGDYAYRALRGVFRSVALKAFVNVMPEKVVELIGKRSSRYSKARKPVLADALPEGRRERLRKTFRNFAALQAIAGFDFIVLGHCHDLDEMEFTVGERKSRYYNVGYPRLHGSYLVWTSGTPGMNRVPLTVSM